MLFALRATQLRTAIAERGLTNNLQLSPFSQRLSIIIRKSPLDIS